METIPENQSGAVGAEPLSPAMTDAIKGVDLDLGEKTHKPVQVANAAPFPEDETPRRHNVDLLNPPKYEPGTLNLDWVGQMGVAPLTTITSWNVQQIEQRIQQLMAGTPYGDSQSVMLAMKQLANELYHVPKDKTDVSISLDGDLLIKTTEGLKPRIALKASDFREATEDLHYGDALNRLKRGMAMARKGWNGHGMFVYHVPAAAYPAQTGVAKAFFGENALVPYNEYLAIKNVNGTVSTWVASINDQMANDWYVAKFNIGVEETPISPLQKILIKAELGEVLNFHEAFELMDAGYTVVREHGNQAIRIHGKTGAILSAMVPYDSGNEPYQLTYSDIKGNWRILGK